MIINRRNITLSALLAIAAIWSVISMAKNGVLTTHDSESYVDAFDVYLSGGLDKFRTPVYPLFLGLFKTIFGVGFFQIATILAQHIIFVISVLFFFITAEITVRSNTVVSIFTTVFIVAIEVANWNNYIMTESLSTSFFVFFVYQVIRLWTNPMRYSLLWCVLWGIVVLLLRPAFVYVIIACAIMAVLLPLSRDGGSKSAAIKGGVLTIVLCVVAFSYSFAFKSRYGVATFSNVSIVNKYYTLRQNGLIDTSNISNRDLAAEIENFKSDHGEIYTDVIGTYREFEIIDNTYPLRDIDEVVNVSVSCNKAKCIRLVLDRFRLSLTDYGTNPMTVVSLLKNKLFYIYVLLAVASILLLMNFFRRNPINYPVLFFYLLGMGHLCVTIIGAQGDWHRLFEPAMPAYLLLACAIFYDYVKPCLIRVLSRNKPDDASTR